MQPVGTQSSVSSHGGRAATFSFDVIAVGGSGGGVVRLGDIHVCPIIGHGTTPFFSSATETADGRPIVRVGIDPAGCGAVMITGANQVLAQ